MDRAGVCDGGARRQGDGAPLPAQRDCRTYSVHRRHGDRRCTRGNGVGLRVAPSALPVLGALFTIGLALQLQLGARLQSDGFYYFAYLRSIAFDRDQTIECSLDATAWRFGVNTLTLQFGYSQRPVDVGVGADPRPLAAAVDWLRVSVVSQ